jgi:uncharacterized membrane protein YjjB (DUF3815 family)
MKKLLACRRSIVACLAILCLSILSYKQNNVEAVAAAIAAIAMGLAGANAFEAKKKEE